jgi:hypothetical protein
VVSHSKREAVYSFSEIGDAMVWPEGEISEITDEMAACKLTGGSATLQIADIVMRAEVRCPPLSRESGNSEKRAIDAHIVPAISSFISAVAATYA